MKKVLLSLALIVSSLVAFAQDEVNIFSDRPTATAGTDVMAPGSFQWETGTAYERSRLSGDLEKKWLINNSLFRLGVFKFAELRFTIDESKTYTEAGNYSGISNLSAGTKVKVYGGKGAIPAVSLLGEVLIPGSKDSHYLPSKVGGNLQAVFGNSLCSWASLGYQAGITWTGVSDAKPSKFLSAALSFSPANRLGLFVEEYNNFAEETACWAKAGATYLVSKRVQLDISADMSLNHPDKYFNIGVGLVWRIK